MSASKAKGTAWERDVVALLAGTFGPEVERRALAGVNDKGDVAGIPGVVIECKAERAIDLAGYMGELEREITNAKAWTGMAFVKRRQKGVAEGYAVMPIHRAIALLDIASQAGRPAKP